MTTYTPGRLCDLHFVNTMQVLEELVDSVFRRHQFTTASVPILSSTIRLRKVGRRPEGQPGLSGPGLSPSYQREAVTGPGTETLSVFLAASHFLSNSPRFLRRLRPLRIVG